jgi:chromosome segregation ATPase
LNRWRGNNREEQTKREKIMIQINALFFLFLMQFLLIFLGLAVVLFLKFKKINIKTTISQGEIRRLESEIDRYKKEVTGLLNWQTMFNDLQKKFEHTTAVNSKLKAMIDALIPEAERSKEFQEILNEVENNNKELSACIGSLKNENEEINKQMRSFKNEVDGLSKKLRDSVTRKEYENLLSEKTRLELKVGHMKEDLEKKTKEIEKLEKNYMYLEKEYNALYDNLKGEGA